VGWWGVRGEREGGNRNGRSDGEEAKDDGCCTRCSTTDVDFVGGIFVRREWSFDDDDDDDAGERGCFGRLDAFTF
jgi:hypothetical protein